MDARYLADKLEFKGPMLEQVIWSVMKKVASNDFRTF